MKITLKQFYEDFPKYKACIHCKTQEQARKLLDAFDSMGKRWQGGESYSEDTFWEEYYENTVYYNSNQFGNINYAKGESGLVIIEFEEVVFVTEELKQFIRSIK